jgi:putative phosphoesterase
LRPGILGLIVIVWRMIMDTKKLLVISDSHGYIDKLEIALRYGKKQNIEDAVFLGDGVADVKPTCKKIDYSPNWSIVRGNHDLSEIAPNKETLEFGGHRFFLCHGKEYELNNGYSKLCKAAKNMGADIALCGHQHDCKKEKSDDLLIIKVGSIGVEYPHSTRSFIVIECPPEKDIVVNLYEIRNEEIEHSIL